MWRSAAAYLRRHGLDPDGANDAIGAVMARLARKMPNPIPDNWEAYLVTAATNAARDAAKKNARRPDRPDRAADVSVSHIDTPNEEQPMDDEVADAVDRLRVAARVRQSVDALPPHERKAVRETLLRHRTNRDVGDEMGVTAARVSQLKHAGLRRLASELDSEWIYDRS